LAVDCSNGIPKALGEKSSGDAFDAHCQLHCKVIMCDSRRHTACDSAMVDEKCVAIDLYKCEDNPGREEEKPPSLSIYSV
jgi:hypothetical protein